MSALRYPHRVPALGSPVEVTPGLFWVRVALPFALDHVHLFLGDEGDHWSVLDTGLGDPPTRAVWEALLTGPLLRGRPIGHVIVTHFHPDHVGQAGWLVEATGAAFSMPRTEWLCARWLAQDESAEFLDGGERFARAMGLPEAIRAHQRRRGNAYRRGVTPPPPVYRRIQDGELVRFASATWRVVMGEGHAPEQATLVRADRAVLLAADQVLPRISPNVGAWPSEPEADALGLFLASLERYRELPDDVLVLPSHDRPFLGLHARIAAIRAHHEERLARTLEACRGGATGHAVMTALFDRVLDIHQVGFAISETRAHLNRLLAIGAVSREPDADGTLIWRPA